MTLFVVVVAALASLVAGTTYSELDYAQASFFTTIDSGNCTHNVRLLWQTETGSSLFAPPLITDVFSDGRKDIVAPTFTHYLEVLDGLTGNDVHGWPYAHPKFSSQTSPLRFDVQRDGTAEIMIGTFDGDVVFFTEAGEPLPEYTIAFDPFILNVHDPKVKSLVEAAKVHRAATDAAAKETAAPRTERQLGDAILEERLRHAARAVDASPAKPKVVASQDDPSKLKAKNVEGAVVGESAPSGATAKKLLQVVPEVELGDAPTPLDGAGAPMADYYDDPDEMYGFMGDTGGKAQEITQLMTTDGMLSPEARASMDLVYHPELFDAAEVAAKNEGSDPFANVLLRGSRRPLEAGSVYLEPHILATPSLADIDGDGHPDLICPITYYVHHKSQVSLEFVEKDLPDPADFVVSALVVYDMVTRRLKWQHTFPTTLRAAKGSDVGRGFLMGTPTVVSIDMKSFQIVLATGSGELHVFDARGDNLPGFPITSLGAIPSQPLVDDITGDGHIDICVAGSAGVVSCFDPRTSRPHWKFDLDGAVSDGIVAGDVNGDGHLDIVATTARGSVFALDGRTGTTVAGFPVRGVGGFVASALLINLNNTNPPMSIESTLGMHIVVPNLDGRIYIVSGTTACIEYVDIAHVVYAPILADDLTGNGRMDLIVATLSGSILVLATDAPYHPMKAWPSRPLAMNGLTARWGYFGIYVEPQYHQARNVRGEFFRMVITVEDRRPAVAAGRIAPLYFVTVTIGTGLLVLSKMYAYPGSHLEIIPTPAEAVFGTVTVTLQLPSGQRFDDRFALSFNMHFLETVRFMVLIPFLVCMGALLLVRRHHTQDASATITTFHDQGTGRRSNARRFMIDEDADLELLYYEIARNRDRAAPVTRRPQRPQPAPGNRGAPAPATNVSHDAVV